MTVCWALVLFYCSHRWLFCTVLPSVLFCLFSVLQNWLVFHCDWEGRVHYVGQQIRASCWLHIAWCTHTHTHKLPESTNRAASQLVGFLQTSMKQNKTEMTITGLFMCSNMPCDQKREAHKQKITNILLCLPNAYCCWRSCKRPNFLILHNTVNKNMDEFLETNQPSN